MYSSQLRVLIIVIFSVTNITKEKPHINFKFFLNNLSSNKQKIWWAKNCFNKNSRPSLSIMTSNLRSSRGSIFFFFFFYILQKFLLSVYYKFSFFLLPKKEEPYRMVKNKKEFNSSLSYIYNIWELYVQCITVCIQIFMCTRKALTVLPVVVNLNIFKKFASFFRLWNALKNKSLLQWFLIQYLFVSRSLLFSLSPSFT